MKQAEQSNRQRQARIEHIFRAADDVAPESATLPQNRRCRASEKKQPDATQEKISGLSSHKPIRSAHFPDVAEKKKILRPYCRQ
jgi:hypothetical protein